MSTPRPMAIGLADATARQWPCSPFGILTSTPLLLDTITGAFAAYGMQKLRTAYSGPCLRIRRDSDSTEQDIGFVANALDTAAISSFCGAGSGYVTKWYDQSGNARDLAQATTTIQPIIFESGVLCVLNSKPCLKFVAASAHRMTNGVAGDWNFLHNGVSPWTWVGVTQANDTASGKAAWATHSSVNPLGASVLRSGTEALQVQVGNGTGPVVNVTTSQTSAVQRLNTVIADPANATAANRVNEWGNGSALTGTNAATGIPGAGNSSVFTVGTRTSTVSPWDGTQQGHIFWESDQSANRPTIESALNTFYGVY